MRQLQMYFVCLAVCFNVCLLMSGGRALQAAGGSKESKSSKPNIIIVIADQLRYQSVGYAGDRKAITPHIDRLATESINFSNYVVSTPVCSATRATLWTGKYASSTGVVVNELRVNPNHDSIAHVLNDDGYTCDFIGKWHIWAN